MKLVPYAENIDDGAEAKLEEGFYESTKKGTPD